MEPLDPEAPGICPALSNGCYVACTAVASVHRSQTDELFSNILAPSIVYGLCNNFLSLTWSCAKLILSRNNVGHFNDILIGWGIGGLIRVSQVFCAMHVSHTYPTFKVELKSSWEYQCDCHHFIYIDIKDTSNTRHYRL